MGLLFENLKVQKNIKWRSPQEPSIYHSFAFRPWAHFSSSVPATFFCGSISHAKLPMFNLWPPPSCFPRSWVMYRSALQTGGSLPPPHHSSASSLFRRNIEEVMMQCQLKRRQYETHHFDLSAFKLTSTQCENIYKLWQKTPSANCSPKLSQNKRLQSQSEEAGGL